VAKQDYCICYMGNKSLMHVVPPLKIVQLQLTTNQRQANQMTQNEKRKLLVHWSF